MHPGTGGFIDDLTTSMEIYVDYIMTAIVNIFKFMFCEYDSTGNITGLNLLGSIVIVLLAIKIVIVLIRKLLESVTPWHHDEAFISEKEEKEAIQDPTIITEQEDYKLTHQIYLKERKEKIYNDIKEIRKQNRIAKLRENWKSNKK